MILIEPTTVFWSFCPIMDTRQERILRRCRTRSFPLLASQRTESSLYLTNYRIFNRTMLSEGIDIRKTLFQGLKQISLCSCFDNFGFNEFTILFIWLNFSGWLASLASVNLDCPTAISSWLLIWPNTYIVFDNSEARTYHRSLFNLLIGIFILSRQLDRNFSLWNERIIYAYRTLFSNTIFIHISFFLENNLCIRSRKREIQLLQ